jgi:hypothetical protein
MSYDYMIVRLRNPAADINDLSPESCVMGDWLEEGRGLLRERLPELVWQETDGRLSGDGSHLGTGRLSVDLHLFEGLTQVWVVGSHRSDQSDWVRKVAAAVDGVGFDLQTGKRLG